MMKSVALALALFACSSTAFVSPGAQIRHSNVLNAEVEAPPPPPSGAGMDALEGAASTQGIPNFVFDPLALSEQEFWGQSNEATIGFLRHAEIKHGRVAMAGFVGFCVHSAGLTWPFKMTLAGDDWPTLGDGGAPELWDKIPAGAKWQIILTVGLLEWWDEYQFEPEKNVDKPKHYMRGGRPGDYPNFFESAAKNQFLPLNLFDPFQLSKKMTPEQSERRLTMEINNGRLAMIGLFAFLAESKVPGAVPFLAGKIPLYAGEPMVPFEGNFHLFQ
jgi:hypothetical protein